MRCRGVTINEGTFESLPEGRMAAVSIEGVTKTFQQHVAVNDLSLEVPRGSIYGFIGPNGSGKTTTLRMIMRILYPDRGVLHVLDEPLHGKENGRSILD